MGIVNKVFRRLLPRGKVWNFVDLADSMLTAATLELQRVYDIIKATEAESRPESATKATIKEWVESKGIAYDETMSLDRARTMVWAIHSAVGNCTLPGLKAQLDKEFTNLTITETDAGGYEITGTVVTATEALRVGAVLARHAPLHLVPTVFGYTAATVGNPNPIPPGFIISGLITPARTGRAIGGRTVCGRVTTI